MHFRRNDRSIWTEGLGLLGRREIRLQANGRYDLIEAESLLGYVVDHLITHDVTLEAGRTMAYGYWVISFESADDGFLDVCEADVRFSDFVPGANLAITYWRQQHELCARFNAGFEPPEPRQMVAVSDGVFEGEAVQGFDTHLQNICLGGG